MQLPDKKSPTWLVVGGVIGAALIAFLWLVLSPWWAIGASILLAYEGWTLKNKYEHDTISEVVWVLAKRPMVPFIFGAGVVALICHGVIQPTVSGLYVAIAVGFLMGHFFFQRAGDE